MYFDEMKQNCNIIILKMCMSPKYAYYFVYIKNMTMF